jgi:hypothetical protein
MNSGGESEGTLPVADDLAERQNSPSWNNNAMPRSKQPEQHFPVKLTQAQRKAVAEVAPELAERLKLNDRGQRAIPLTPAELQTVKEKGRTALRQAGTGRGRVPLRYAFQACGQALDQHLDATALPEEGMMEWFLAELRAVAGRYQWQYVAPGRQAQLEQIAYRIWQEAGCPQGRHEEHWRQAEGEFHADKPIRGAVVDGPEAGQVGQLLSPLQAVAHARTGAVYPVSVLVKEAGLPVTAGEAGAIEAAADAAPEGNSAALRAGIAKAVGLER